MTRVTQRFANWLLALILAPAAAIPAQAVDRRLVVAYVEGNTLHVWRQGDPAKSAASPRYGPCDFSAAQRPMDNR
jgi:hypothetical protein